MNSRFLTRLRRHIRVRDSLQKSEWSPFSLANPSLRSYVSRKLRCSPACSLFTGIALLTPANRIASVIELDNFVRRRRNAREENQEGHSGTDREAERSHHHNLLRRVRRRSAINQLSDGSMQLARHV